MMYFSRNLTFVLLCAFSGTAFAGSNCVNKILEEIFNDIPISLKYEDLYDSITRLKEIFDY